MYRHRSVPKPNGSHRKISAPNPRLKEIQRALAKRLSELPLSQGIYGGPRSSTMEAMLPHLNKPTLVKMDLSDFFPSIKAPRVRKYFESILDDANLARDFTRICTAEGHLPQGAPTSPAIARLILEPAFLAARNALKQMDSRCEISIWVDDIAISGPAGIKRAQKTIQHIFESYGFSINPDKTEVISSGNKKEALGLSLGKELKPCVNTLAAYSKCLKEEPWNRRRIQGFENYFRSIRKANKDLLQKI